MLGIDLQQGVGGDADHRAGLLVDVPVVAGDGIKRGLADGLLVPSQHGWVLQAGDRNLFRNANEYSSPICLSSCSQENRGIS